MLACVIADDELFGILKEIYAQVDNMESVRLYLSALRYIKDEALDVRKKELRKILNAKKKELSTATWLPVYRNIHQQGIAPFGYFDAQFDEAAFGNTNLKRELG